jgi:hypothetical protein
MIISDTALTTLRSTMRIGGVGNAFLDYRPRIESRLSSTTAVGNSFGSCSLHSDGRDKMYTTAAVVEMHGLGLQPKSIKAGRERLLSMTLFETTL